jgi:transcriptional regulator with XRE-family HTH domain
MSVYESIGRRIRELRDAAGLTQEQLAQAAHLTRGSIANIETGRQAILTGSLIDIAEGLGVSPAALLPDGKVTLTDKLRQRITHLEAALRRQAADAKAALK